MDHILPAIWSFGIQMCFIIQKCIYYT